MGRPTNRARPIAEPAIGACQQRQLARAADVRPLHARSVARAACGRWPGGRGFHITGQLPAYRIAQPSTLPSLSLPLRCRKYASGALKRVPVAFMIEVPMPLVQARRRDNALRASLGIMSPMPVIDPNSSLTVHCLCAEWCGVCREWRALFDAMAAAHPAHRFVWVDVDTHEAVLDLMDIETFPVLLIARGDEPLFCGPVEPTPAQVGRLLALTQPAAQLDPAARPLLDLLRTA